MRKVLGIVLVGLAILGPASAWALDIPLFDLRAGIRGGMDVNVLNDVNEDHPQPVYPGFVGLGWNIGGGISFDYMKMIGLEIEFLFSSDSGTGSVSWDRDLGTDNTKEQSDFTLSNTSLHLPIMVTGSIPAGIASPFIHLGVDFNFSRSNHDLKVQQRGDAPPFTEGCQPGINCDPFPQRDYGVHGIDSSTYFLLGLGMEIDVTSVTVPIELRALINPNFGNSITDRTRFTGGTPAFLYNDEWHYQFMVLVGVNYVIF